MPRPWSRRAEFAVCRLPRLWGHVLNLKPLGRHPGLAQPPLLRLDQPRRRLDRDVLARGVNGRRRHRQPREELQGVGACAAAVLCDLQRLVRAVRRLVPAQNAPPEHARVVGREELRRRQPGSARRRVDVGERPLVGVAAAQVVELQWRRQLLQDLWHDEKRMRTPLCGCKRKCMLILCTTLLWIRRQEFEPTEADIKAGKQAAFKRVVRTSRVVHKPQDCA
eukprot:3478526-Pleurochrysis_carterae.AAC.3